MTAHPEHDDFDRLLTRAMTARPEPGAPANLAKIAMERAVTEEKRIASQQLQRLLRLRRRSRLVAFAAAVFVAIALCAVVTSTSIRQHMSMSWSSSSSGSTSSDSSTSDSSSSSIGIGVILTAEGLSIAVILLSLRAPPGFARDPELIGHLFA